MATDRSKEVYKQCKMVKQDGQSKLINVAFIPNGFAKVGRNISLRKADGEWDDGWVVEEVWSSRTFDEIDLQRDAHKRWDEVLGR